MTTTSLHLDSPRRTAPVGLTSTAAIVFAVAYSVAMFVPTLPEGAYSDAKVLALMDGGDRTRIIIGGYALAVAGAAFLVFTAGLLDRVLDAGRPAWRGLTLAAASVYAATLMVAAAFFSSIAMGVALGELEAEGQVDLFRVLSNAGFHVVLVGGLIVASLVVGAVSATLRQDSAVPGWVPIMGFVIAPLLLLGFAWVPQFLLPVWAVVVGLRLRRPVD